MRFYREGGKDGYKKAENENFRGIPGNPDVELTPSAADAKHQPHEKYHCTDRSKALSFSSGAVISQLKTVSGQCHYLPSSPTVLSAPSRQTGVVAAVG